MTCEQLVAPQPKLVRIMLGPVSDEPRLRRPICGKASPFGRTCILQEEPPGTDRKAGGFPQVGAAEPRCWGHCLEMLIWTALALTTPWPPLN
jgi:hypothetical protein